MFYRNRKLVKRLMVIAFITVFIALQSAMIFSGNGSLKAAAEAANTCIINDGSGGYGGDSNHAPGANQIGDWQEEANRIAVITAENGGSPDGAAHKITFKATLGGWPTMWVNMNSTTGESLAGWNALAFWIRVSTETDFLVSPRFGDYTYSKGGTFTTNNTKTGETQTFVGNEMTLPAGFEGWVLMDLTVNPVCGDKSWATFATDVNNTWNLGLCLNGSAVAGKTVYMDSFQYVRDVDRFPQKDTAAPTFAPAVQVTQRTSEGLTLNWTAARDDVTAADALAYAVYASETPFGGAVSGDAALTAVGALSGTVTGLRAETAYYIAITARDEAGNLATWFSAEPVSTTAVNTSTGQLTITADVGVSYTLSIPTSMGTITAAGDHKAGTLYASKLTLGEGCKLTVTASHGVTLTHANQTNRLAYTLKSAAYASAELAAYQPAEFANDSVLGEAGGKDLYVSIAPEAWEAAAAGTYTDTVTFQAVYSSEK